MLPSALFTTFRRYKEDTQAITEWLATTAKLCGYQARSVSEHVEQSIKPKNKNKKKRKTAAATAAVVTKEQTAKASSLPIKEYVVTASEYVPMARTIAESIDNKVIIPLSVLRTWKSCITGRSVTADWYEVNADVEERDGNISHEFFIEILKQSLQILVPIAKLQELDRHQFKLPRDKTIKVDGSAQSSNKFAHLEIQDIDEKAYEALADASSPSGGKSNAVEKTMKYVAEGPDYFDEWYFALHCFMEDMEMLQEQAKSHWMEYADGDTDLVTAAVSTNIAIEMVKRAEEEFLKVKRPAVIEAWGEVDLPMAWYGHCLARDEIQPREAADPRKYFVPMDAWEQAKESYLLLHRLVIVYSNGIVPGSQGVDRIFALTRPAYYGTYNPELEFEDLSDKKQYEQMAACLNDMLVTIGALTSLAETPSDDMLMLGIHYLQHHQVNPPMWLLFACQNFLDIHFILKTRSERPYEELRDFAIATRRTLKQHQAFMRDNRLPRMRAQEDEDAVDEVLEEIETWVLNDEIKKLLCSIEQTGSTKKRRVWQDFEVLRMSPLLCGMMKYNFHIQLQWKGITLVNDTGLVAAAHLYNAVQAAGYLGKEPMVWDDMEYLLVCYLHKLLTELHKSEDTFMGKRPQSIEDCTKRLALVQGVAPTTFARRRRGHNHRVLRSRNGSRFLKPSTPVAQILGVKFLMPHAPFDWHFEQLETLVGVAFERDIEKMRKDDIFMEQALGHIDLSTPEGKRQLLYVFDPPAAIGEAFCKEFGIPVNLVRAGVLERRLQESIFDYDWKSRILQVLRLIKIEERAKQKEAVSSSTDPSNEETVSGDSEEDSDDTDVNDDLPGKRSSAGEELMRIHERWRQDKVLPLVMFIDIVHDSLEREYLDIQFDYFAFFRSTFSLMQDMQMKLKPLLDPWLSEGLTKERLREPEGAVCVMPQMALLLACNPLEAPNIMALRGWLAVDTRPLRAAADVMRPWIEENGDRYCITESDREDKRTEDILREGPKVHYFDSDDENNEAPINRKAEDRKVGWSSSLGIVEGLNAREMREIYDAMKDDDPMSRTVAETIALLKGTDLDEADRVVAESNRRAAREAAERDQM